MLTCLIKHHENRQRIRWTERETGDGTFCERVLDVDRNTGFRKLYLDQLFSIDTEWYTVNIYAIK